MLLILAVQVALPLLLIVSLWCRPPASRITFVALLLAVAALLLALAAAGLWTILPVWLPLLFALLLGVGTFRALRRMQHAALPASWRKWIAIAPLGLLALYAGFTLAGAIRGRTQPGVIDLASPLRGGGLLVANGGGTETVNAHLMTLDPAVTRFRGYRGQSFGIDIVRLNKAGRTTNGLHPADPARYAIFDDPLYAPCSGRVVAARSDRPDMPVPRMDRDYLLGNHVVLACGAVHVVLAHFRQGTVRLRPGMTVSTGQYLGRVGNSGNSQEPHLHLHAQTPGSQSQPIAGEPLPIRINGRDLVRNDRL